MELKTLFDQYFLRVRVLDSLRAQVAARIKLPTQVEMPAIAKQTESMSMTFLPDELMDSEDEVFNDDEDEDVVANGKDIMKKGRNRRGDDLKLITDEAKDGAAEAINSRATTRLRVQTAGSYDDS